MKIGYARVSTKEQDLALQLDALKTAGCRQIFQEKITGTKIDRPQLQAMLNILRLDDIIVVWKLDRLARSLKDLVNLVNEIQDKGAGLQSLHDHIDTTTPHGKFTFHVFAALAEFERDIISERTKAGLAAARARGRKGGRPKGLSQKPSTQPLSQKSCIWNGSYPSKKSVNNSQFQRGHFTTICGIKRSKSAALTEPIPQNLFHLAHATNLVVLISLILLISFSFVTDISKAEAELSFANQRARDSLFNVLPASIVQRLEEQGTTFAEYHENCTVLFLDLVGFTKLAQAMPPDKLVGMLNKLFLEFGKLTEKHGVEKIKTIGDAYMAVAGVPVTQARHAEQVASLALNLRDFVNAHSELDVRIGIHSESVVAGVIGSKRLTFDLWGDTVNAAARMESHGQPGRIQISEQTYLLLPKNYIVEARGPIEIKGKGEMNTFFLIDHVQSVI